MAQYTSLGVPIISHTYAKILLNSKRTAPFSDAVPFDSSIFSTMYEHFIFCLSYSFYYYISRENIRKNKPADGLVQVLKITEKQFGKMEFIVGTKKSEILDTDERVVII